MQILQLVQKRQRRGAEIFAWQLSNAMRAKNHHVRIIYLYKYSDPNALPVHADDIELNGDARHFSETLFGAHPKYLGRLLNLLKELQPDIVQLNGGRSVKYGALAKLLQRHNNWKLVYKNIDSPEYWVRDRMRLLFYRHLVIPRMDGIVGVSKATLEGVKRLYHIKVPAVHIPNGRDPSNLNTTFPQSQARAELNIPQDVPVLVFIGNLATQKRPDRLLRVVAKVKQHFERLCVLVLGDGPLRAEVERTIQDLGLEQTVHLYGYQKNIELFIVASDLLLLTSDSEGTPGVVLEAGLLGKPSVATYVGGVAECVKNGETGLLIPPEDEDGLVAAVMHLLNNKALLTHMSEQAKAYIHKNFGIDRIADLYLDFYKNLINVDMVGE